LQFAGYGHREFFDEFDVVRDFEMRQTVATVRLDVLFAQRLAFMQFDPGHAFFAHAFVGHAEYGGLGDGGMFEQPRFDFGGVNVLGGRE